VTVLPTLPKNSREEVRVSLTSYRGHQFVDVRVYAGDGDLIVDCDGEAKGFLVCTRAGHFDVKRLARTWRLTMQKHYGNRLRVNLRVGRRHKNKSQSPQRDR
jgi:hypothetical protein